MSTHNFFTLYTNLLGINFGSPIVPYGFIALFHAASVAFQLFMSVKSFIFFNSFDIFFVIQTFHRGFPIVAHLFMIFWAFRARRRMRRIGNLIDSFKVLKNTRIKRKFYLLTAMRVMPALARIFIVFDHQTTIAEFSTMISDFVFSSNDSLFVFYCETLGNHLQLSTESVDKSTEVEIMKNFDTMAEVQKIFSLPLLLTVSYNFILMINSLFWVVMRIIYGLLKTFEGYL